MFQTVASQRVVDAQPKITDKLHASAVETHLAGSFVVTLKILAETMVSAVLAKCTGTYGHSQRVGILSYIAALGLDLDRKQADYYYIAGLLHDIGKIGLSDSLLDRVRRQEELSPEESLEARQHCRLGAQMIDPISKRMLTHEKLDAIIMHHHELYDGSGYPGGLKGTRIPLGARIVGCADALALRIEKRCSVEESLAGLSRESHEKYDPYILMALQKYTAKAEVCLRGIRERQGNIL